MKPKREIVSQRLEEIKASLLKLCALRASVVYLAVIFLLPSFAVAQGPLSEDAAFKAAARAFQLGAYDRARREFSEFLATFPQSPNVPEAVLLQAVAALKLSDSKQTISLLSTNLPKAGAYTDQYRYWLGEANLQGSNYVAAAESFSRLMKDFPESARVLEATYGEALARFRLKEWRRVIDLLQSENSPFQKLAQTRPNDELVLRSFLLLVEALMEEKQWPSAETVLNNLSNATMTPELKWQSQNLLCRIQLGQKRLPLALAGSSNLVTLAEAATSPPLRTEAIILQGSILEQLDRPSEAAAVYEENLRKEVPADRRRQALLKIIELTLAQDAVADAAKRLERLLADHPTDAGSDIARLTLGELRLKQYFSQSTGAANGTNSTTGPEPPIFTNALQSALSQFDTLLRNSPQSSVAGKAQLDRGWSLWELGKITESASSFKAAAEQLSHSEDQAIARFKLGDALLFQKNYSNALDNFRVVLTGYDDIPSVKRTLVPHALYHTLRCTVELNQLPEAERVMRQILDSRGDSTFAEKSFLLLGQQLSTARQPRAARQLLADFQNRFPSSPLLPEVEMALARSHVQEKKWDAAIKQYDQWIEHHPTNQLRPQAEFNRGWAHFQAGRDTNALMVFTNFLNDFPTNELAPAARRWVGDFYYRQSDFENAERNYQLLFQNTNWPVTRLTYEARMLAGQAAFARQGYKSAADYFRSLINDNNCARDYPDLLAQAFFALGDTMIYGDPEPGQTPLQKFDHAKDAFRKIPANSSLAPRASGAIANCYLQMASFDPRFYDNAKEEYQKVLNMAEADVSTRSQAEVGLGAAFEGQAHLSTSTDPDALLDTAFNHYFNVLSGKTSGEEQGDIFWIKQAGLAAARVAEERKQWSVALNIYNHLSVAVPAARNSFQRKIDRLREQLRSDKN